MSINSSGHSFAEPTADVRSTGLRYGLLLGLVSIAYFIILAVSGVNTSQGWGQWSERLLCIGLLVLAHFYFKDYNEGYMSYGQGLGISFWMGLVYGLMLYSFLLVYITYFDPEFMKNAEYLQQQAMMDQGLGEEQIEQAMVILRKFNSPGFFFVFGLLGKIFVMTFLGLLTSIFTQRKDDRMESF